MKIKPMKIEEAVQFVTDWTHTKHAKLVWNAGRSLNLLAKNPNLLRHHFGVKTLDELYIKYNISKAVANRYREVAEFFEELGIDLSKIRSWGSGADMALVRILRNRSFDLNQFKAWFKDLVRRGRKNGKGRAFPWCRHLRDYYDSYVGAPAKQNEIISIKRAITLLCNAVQIAKDNYSLNEEANDIWDNRTEDAVLDFRAQI